MQKILLLLLLLLPGYALGYHVAGHTENDFAWLVATLLSIMRTLVVFIFALTFLAIMWGLIRGWIIGGGDAESVASGKKIVLTGIIVLVVMTSIWGILYMLQSSIFGR